MTEWAALIQAIASLTWPLVAGMALWIYRPEVKSLMVRLKRGKVFGQEIELNTSLVELQVKADAVASEVTSIPATGEGISESAKEAKAERSRDIIFEAGSNPKAALMLLASDIEREIRHFIAQSGQFQRGSDVLSPSGSIRILSDYGLPSALVETLKVFQRVRNRIVHGYDASDDEILRAIDSGMLILKAIQAIPVEIHTVEYVDVPIYSDPAALKKIENGTGIILRARRPDGSEVLQIFPTTKRHFLKGERVAWEWSFDNTWGPTWYRDPGTGETKQAWGSAAEFIGRHVKDV